VKTLEEQGWSLFWDWSSIPVGKTWREFIDKELETAKCVLVIWSKNSITSEWVLEEADFAKKRKILIPILIDEVDPPIGFGQNQAASIIGWNGEPNHEGFQQVIGALTELLGSPNIYEEDKLVLEKHIDTSMLKKIMGIIYQEYNLSQTKLMEPDIDDFQTQIHSHTLNGYFNFLIQSSEKKYSFKYWDNADMNRFLIICVDNNKPELRLQLNLSLDENREIKSRFEKAF